MISINQVRTYLRFFRHVFVYYFSWQLFQNSTLLTIKLLYKRLNHVGSYNFFFISDNSNLGSSATWEWLFKFAKSYKIALDIYKNIKYISNKDLVDIMGKRSCLMGFVINKWVMLILRIILYSVSITYLVYVG